MRRRAPPAERGRRRERLGFADVGRLQTLRAARDVELHAITFDEALEALRLDRAVVDEHVLTTLLGDEAEALRIVEPLHGTGCHVRTVPFGASMRSSLIRPPMVGGCETCINCRGCDVHQCRGTGWPRCRSMARS